MITFSKEIIKCKNKISSCEQKINHVILKINAKIIKFICIKCDYLIFLLNYRKNLKDRENFFFYDLKFYQFINCKLNTLYNLELIYFNKSSIYFNVKKKMIFLEKRFLFKLIKKNWQYFFFPLNNLSKHKLYRFCININNLFKYSVLRYQKYIFIVQRFFIFLESKHLNKKISTNNTKKKKTIVRYTHLTEGDIFIHCYLNPSLWSLFENIINFSYFSNFIINNTFLFKNLLNLVLKYLIKKFFIKNLIIRRFFFFYEIIKIIEKKILKKKTNVHSNKIFKSSIIKCELLCILIEWLKNLSFYLKNIKFKFIKKKNGFLFLYFSKKKKTKLFQ